MARPLRYIPPGSTVEVTCRTMQGRLLLRPSSAVNDLIAGVVGRAQTLYPVLIHGLIVLSNHLHMLLTVADGAELASFMAYVNSNIAREVGRLHEWREKFWGRRYRAIVVADEEAQVNRLRYLLSNGCKEGLVGKPGDWPGVTSAGVLTEGDVMMGTWYDRHAEYEARRRGERVPIGHFGTKYVVRHSALPCWRELDVGGQRARCQALVSEIEGEAKERAREEERAPMGKRAVLGQDPHGRPAHSDRSAAPLVHATTNLVRHTFLAAYFGFVEAFKRASGRLRRREPGGGQFPPFAFPPPAPYLVGPAALALTGS